MSENDYRIMIEDKGLKNILFSKDIIEEAKEISKHGVVKQDPLASFVYTFQTEKNKYVYDVNTMRILRVDPVVWEIISDFGVLSRDEIVSKHSARYSVDEILSAYDRILETQQQKGLLLSNRPAEILMSFTEENIRQKLSKSREQLILNVTEDCNFRCAYCVYSDRYKQTDLSQRYMKWDIAKKAIDDFIAHSAHIGKKWRAISFYGGEPLLNFSLIRKCVEYVRETVHDENLRFAITINGSLLVSEVADYLASERFIITVSLDGPKEIHDRYRRGKDGSPTWDLVTSNVRKFNEKYPNYQKLGLMFSAVCAAPLNILELDKFFASFDFFGNRPKSIRASSVGRAEPGSVFDERIEGFETLRKKFVENLKTGNINNDPEAPEFQFQRRIFEQGWLSFHKRFSRYGIGCLQHEPRFPKKYCRLSTCIPGVRRTFVNVDGNYYHCERIPESNYLKIGSVEKGFDVAKIRQMLEDWVEFSKDQCKYCWCLSTCQVGCWARANDGEKPTRRLKLFLCAVHRWEKHRMLVDYCSVLEENPRALDYTENITIL